MNRPTTAREALLAEALGELLELTERVESLLPALERTRAALLEADAALLARLEALDSKAVAIGESAKQRAIDDLTRHADAVARQSAVRQAQAMSAAAGVLFTREVEPRMQRLSLSLQQLGQRVERPWERWLIHAATVTTSSVVTGAVMIFVTRT
jgi:hypothetical protein